MPRADAVENRRRILDAAFAAISEPSPTMSLNAIAKQAGVGIGTLYRHFPTREALFAEVYRTEREQLVASADELLATRAPHDALVTWLERFTHLGRVKLGFADTLATFAVKDQLVEESYSPIIGALSRLLAANEQAHTLRPGLDPDDVLLMLAAVWRVPPTPKGDAQATRMLALILDGLAGPKAPRRGQRVLP